VKLLEVEAARPLEPIEDLDRASLVRCLVRWRRRPLGWVELPAAGGRITADRLGTAITLQYGDAILRELLVGGLRTGAGPDGYRIDQLLAEGLPRPARRFPSVSVVVCTRDRTAELELCLEALVRLEYPRFEIIVVDNAPRTDDGMHLVETRFPGVGYVREPRPGLDWARNRGILQATGELVAFTDDDVLVDPDWLDQLTLEFEESPAVMAVTGLVLPYRLDTPSERAFEAYGGFGRGFERLWFHRGVDQRGRRLLPHGAGRFGTGANMAFRRSLFDRIGAFDPALDVGTPTNGGGDLEIFFRLLRRGYALYYEPAAVVRHRHRPDPEGLLRQIEGWGTGFFAFANRSREADPSSRPGFRHITRWWLREWIARRLWTALRQGDRTMRRLITTEVRGALGAGAAWRRSARAAAEIAERFGAQGAPEDPGPGPADETPVSFGVRTVDLAEPLQPLTDIGEFERVRLFVALHGRPLGSVEIPNFGESLGVRRLSEVIATPFQDDLVEGDPSFHPSLRWARTYAALSDVLLPRDLAGGRRVASASPPARVSIVIATCGRPDDLARCLTALRAHRSAQQVEIVVVDNDPASGAAAEVASRFPEVVLVTEHRRGLSYARNRGITVATGDIIVATDDDAVAAPGWLDRLIEPFARPDVMAVTGNTLPLELATPAQRWFERFGGLGRGFVAREFDREWFLSRRGAVPTWEIGATANAAFRAGIFRHPEIGLLDEALGAGTPTGCSEDTDLFYRILKAGGVIVYRPDACVLHRHRAEVAALRSQIRAYCRGHVAYNLVTLTRHGDRRALRRLFLDLPSWHLRRLFRWAARADDYPLRMIWWELEGHLTGALALWASRRRVRALGASDPYLRSAPSAGLASASPGDRALPAGAERKAPESSPPTT
jgi:O-antigen biosynthesis protein